MHRGGAWDRAASAGANLPIRSLRVLRMSKHYNPNTQGWGFALVVCLGTAGLFGWAYSVHASTYRHPRDPMAQQVYFERDTVTAEHGESGDDHGGDH